MAQVSDYDYWDLSTGEGVDDYELHRRYDEMLDECSGTIVIGTLSYEASDVLKSVDPIAYRVGFNDWVDSELGETLTEDEPEDEEV